MECADCVTDLSRGTWGSWTAARIERSSRIGAWLGISISTLLLTGSPGHARPAVQEPNLRWFSGYEFGHVEDDIIRAPIGSILLPETEQHRVSTQLEGTIPIGEQFGARARFGASYIGADHDFGFNASSNSDGYHVHAGAEIFYRDPDRGRLGLGYVYMHTNTDADTSNSVDAHSGTVDAALFLSDLGLGPIDLDLSAMLGTTILSDSGPFDEEDPAYRVVGMARVYPAPRLQLSAGCGWERTEAGLLESDDVRGLMGILWLPPLGAVSNLTAGVQASVGEIDSGLNAGSRRADTDRFVYSVGIEFSILFPGTNSLIELVRERE